MKIGVDVDGVLTNMEEYQLKYGKKYFKKTDDEIDPTQIDIKDIFGVSKTEREKFWFKYIWKYCISEPLRPGAVECLNKLKNCGHEIHIITSRAHTTEDSKVGELFRKMLLYKLKESKLQYDSITYCQESESAKDKEEICKKLNIDVMIEDKKENIETIKEICDVICINASYNKEVEEDEKVKKADNFNEVYEIMKEKDNSLKGRAYTEKDKYAFNYTAARVIGKPIFSLALHPECIDKDKIPKTGSILLCGNHLHVWDQFPVICSTDRVTHWMAKKEYFDSKQGAFFRKTGSICVDRFGDAKKGEKEALNYLYNGGAIGLFPEGTRNRPKREYVNELIEIVGDETIVSKIIDNSSMLITSQVNKLKELYNNKIIDKKMFIECILADNGDCLQPLLKTGVLSLEEYNDSLLLPFKFGAVSMAKKTDSLIVPFGVTGDYTKDNNNLRVSFGEPFRVSDMDLEDANQKLRSDVLKLVINNRSR